VTMTVVEIGTGFMELEGDTVKDLVPFMWKERNGDLVLMEFPLNNYDQNEVDQKLEILLDGDEVLFTNGGKTFHVQVSTEVAPDEG